MKLIKGQTLETILKYRDNATADRGHLVAAFEAVCQAVGYAHAHQVIHRDIKPANVMVGAFGEVQVMDWGLAKVLCEQVPTLADPSEAELTRAWTQVSPTPDSASYTQAGSLVGTPAFIATEQALGEIAKVDARSDVFGLGALLAVILTGKPPYIGETAESVRVLAARGKLDECFARLDASGAEPELVALCKRCLSFEPADWPRDAGAVATAVAGLRSAAEDRARTAERDKAAGEARAEEQRRKRRWQYAAAGAVVLALAGGVLGLGVYLRAQTRANADLAAKNAELADEQAKVQARFDTAVKAIETFHTGVSEDMLLKNPEFKELRTKLLMEARRFYEELDTLLAEQTDATSRRTLAVGYFQLGELMGKIGDNAEAVRLHRQALAVRRELAAEPGADVETRLDVARSLRMLGRQMTFTNNYAGALQAFEEMRDVAERLEALEPSDAVRFVLAEGLHRVGAIIGDTGRLAEALKAVRKPRAILQKLVDANPTNPQFLAELALIHNNIGNWLIATGKPTEALEPFRQALALRQKVAASDPANTDNRQRLGWCHWGVGVALLNTGKPAEAQEANREALAIFQKLVDDQPAVLVFLNDLADGHNVVGVLMVSTGRPAEALEPYRRALAVAQKLAAAAPGDPIWKAKVAWLHNNIGQALDRQKRPEEAITALDVGLTVHQQLLAAEPDNLWFSRPLGWSHAFRGGPGSEPGSRPRPPPTCGALSNSGPKTHPWTSRRKSSGRVRRRCWPGWVATRSPA